MASRTTTDPIEILLEMGVDLDNLSSEEDYLSALMEAAATIEFQTKGSGDERSAVLRKEIIEVRKKRKAADPKFKARTAKISKSSFKPKAKPSGPKALPTSALVSYKKPEEEKEPKSEQKKEKRKSDKSQGLLESILKNVVGIKELLKKRIDITKSIRDIERKNLQKQRRKAKEDKLEEGKQGKNFLKKLKGAVPRLSVFDYLFNWIKNVIMGKILVKIIDWMSDPKNKKKLDSLGRFLKDWWPALTAAFVLFATPLGGFIRAVVGGMAKLTALLLSRAIPALLGFAAKNPIAAAAILGTGAAVLSTLSNEGRRELENSVDDENIVTPKETREKGQTPSGSQLMDEMTRQRGFGGMFSGGGGVPDWLAMAGGGNAFMKPMGTDTVPAMLSPGEFVMSKGAVDTFGSDFMEGINAAGGGTNKPKVMGGTTYAAGGGLVSHHKALLDAISFAEGTTKSYGTIFGGKVVPELAQGKLTIDQVHNMMMTGKLNGRDVGYKTGGKWSSVATGRYQFMPDTLRDIQRSMGLSGDTLFTPEMQDKMIIDRITKFRNVSLNELKTEGLSTKVLDKLAPEFASLPSSQKGGKSYYGQPVKSAEDIRNAFNKSLTGGGGPNTGSGRDGTFGDGTYGSGRPSDPKPSGDPIHPKDDPALKHKFPDNAGIEALGNRNYGFKTGDSDTVGLKGKNYHFTKTEDGWKVTDGGFYGLNKQPVDPKTVPGLVRAFHTKYGHRGTGKHRDGSDNPNDPYKPKTTTDNSKKDNKTKAKIDKSGAFTDIFAGARSRQQTKKATFSSSYIAPDSSDSSSSSSSPSPKIDPTKVTNNPTNLTTNVDFNVGDVTLDPTMQLKDLPGGMDANKLARSHAETKQLSPEQTELLAKQAVKFTKKNGRAPTKSEINKLTVNIFGADVGKKVTDPETLKLIDEEKNINKSKLTPIPLDKVTPTDKLKPVKKDTTQVIDAPPAGSPGAAPQPKANNPQEPDFPTISQSKEAQEVRAMVMANTLGGDFG